MDRIPWIRRKWPILTDFYTAKQQKHGFHMDFTSKHGKSWKYMEVLHLKIGEITIDYPETLVCRGVVALPLTGHHCGGIPRNKIVPDRKKLEPCGALWSILSQTIHTNLAAAVLSLGALGPSGLSSWPLVTQGQFSRREAESTSTNHMDIISIHNTCTNCGHGVIQTHCTFQYQKAPIVLFLFVSPLAIAREA